MGVREWGQGGNSGKGVERDSGRFHEEDSGAGQEKDLGMGAIVGFRNGGRQMDSGMGVKLRF